MHTKLRQLHTNEYHSVCSWAIAEHWPGLIKGQLLTIEEFPHILKLASHFSFALSEEDAAVIGFGQIWLAPNGSTNLVRLLVDPALRGQGYGKRLCALLLAEALRMPGCTQVKLRVRRDNLPAVAVYRSIGFCELEAESNEHVLAMAYAAC
jgi:ribosomal protein S18 acetylase RimI-like enzyme